MHLLTNAQSGDLKYITQKRNIVDKKHLKLLLKPSPAHLLTCATDDVWIEMLAAQTNEGMV